MGRGPSDHKKDDFMGSDPFGPQPHFVNFPDVEPVLDPFESPDEKKPVV